MRARWVVCVCALLLVPAAASAKPRDKTPAGYTGTVTGSKVVRHVEPGWAPHLADRWQVTGLKIKHKPKQDGVFNQQKRRVYKFVAGTVTWTHEGSLACENFTETFSLKDVKLESESEIRFFAPVKGRHKHQWRMNGELFPLRKHTIVCPGYDPYEWQLPALVTGTKVGENSPIARPGKQVRLTNDSSRKIGNEGSSETGKSTLTLRPR
jgi:hypothetical protein